MVLHYFHSFFARDELLSITKLFKTEYAFSRQGLPTQVVRRHCKLHSDTVQNDPMTLPRTSSRLRNRLQISIYVPKLRDKLFEQNYIPQAGGGSTRRLLRTTVQKRSIGNVLCMGDCGHDPFHRSSLDTPSQMPKPPFCAPHLRYVPPSRRDAPPCYSLSVHMREQKQGNRKCKAPLLLGALTDAGWKVSRTLRDARDDQVLTESMTWRGVAFAHA